MLNRKSLSCACATLALTLSAGSAIAADLPPPPPPPVEVVETGCFYVSAGASYISNQRPRVYKNGIGGAWGGTEALGESFSDTGAIDVGVGCAIISQLRTEFNLGYRFQSHLRDSFNSLDADVSTFTGMANLWWDIYDFGGWTPYVGGGVGFNVHDIRSRAPVPDAIGNTTDTTFAWQVGGGFGIDVTDNLVIDVGYRYTDHGRPRSAGFNPFFIDKFRSHEVRLGLRYHFGA